MPTETTSGSDVALEAKVAFLRQPGSYPEQFYRVEAIETHMSWVFLTQSYAYKLKKPVCHDFLDFRRIDARRYFCEEEFRLNRRLAADVYVGVVALTIDSLGQLHLDGNGRVIDWLVKMRRLPAELMLDYAIRNGSVVDNDIRRIAFCLANFYLRCTIVEIEPSAYRAAFLRDIDRNEQELTRPEYRLANEKVIHLCRMQRMVLHHGRDWFDARVRSGKIIEGHGDLRPEHIFIGPDIAVIDCLEFSRDLRIVDPADELGYLALECERLDAPQAGALLLETYSKVCGDLPSRQLLHFYQGFRSMLRARIAIRHLAEEQFRHSAEWRRRAIDYLQLAEKHQDAISSVMDPPL